MTRKTLIRLLLAAAATVGGTAALAADWPSKPIRLLVPATGGVSDELARAVQEPLARALGQPVVVENKTGAFGAIAAMEVARAAPDGHTLMFGLMGTTLILPLQKKASYDPVTSFTPISTIATVPLTIYTRTDIPVKSMRDLLTYARSKPTGVNLAVTGGIGEIYTELLSRRGEFKAVKVPYKGGGPAGIALLAGEVDVWVSTPSGMANSHVKAGKLRTIGVSSAEPSPLAPGAEPVSREIPSIPTVEFWFALMGPPGLPQAITDRLAQTIADIVTQPDTRARFAEIGAVPESSTPAAFAARIARETELYRQMLAELNMN
ncbi:Bug family tripartite tricarboxylate transporter substrate binding protein [Pseudorhodoferax sp.]|uniref:Bug family tripartite tricarboxylate transporter substrate binding protein n=1 Tax=Pseudorhodoferax sp. TaxID=1993553 RepID=UPI002DD64BF6|nr:tripartite tricarboxylate transporter substrate binding protein [Pseudorhodoferax sp.]